MSLSINRAVTCHSLNQYEPVLTGIVKNNIWHFTMCVNSDAKFEHFALVVVAPLFSCVTDIK